jgi:ribosome maturation factor RimP
MIYRAWCAASPVEKGRARGGCEPCNLDTLRYNLACCKGARGLRARCFFYRSEKVRETATLERLTEVVEGVLPGGTELVEARFSGGPLLSVLLDREDGPVDHEFCSRIAAVVAPAVEAEGYDGPIEVSSPGIERPLTKPEHFRRFVGHEAKVRVGEPLDGRRNFTGIIERTGEDAFVLKLSEGAEVELPFGSVTRANLKEDIYK